MTSVTGKAAIAHEDGIFITEPIKAHASGFHFVAQYEIDFGCKVLTCNERGEMVSGCAPQLDCECCGQSAQHRLHAAEQTRYWGETVINLCCDDGYAIWAVPIMQNNDLTGALVVQGIELEGKSTSFHESVERAARALLDLAIENNLLNRAEVELARQRARRESERFLAIEASKQDLISDDIRSIYLTEELGLLSAIKQGQTREARAILNRILISIYGLAGDHMELLKSSILELVVMMNRTAVEAGAEPTSVLGTNYRSLAELSKINDDEELAEWIRRMLENLIERIRSHESYPNSFLLTKAVRHMQANLHQHLRRDDVARVAGVSPSHFSKLMTQRLGRSFSSLLSQLRVNKAKELLTQTDKNLSAISIECGFFDQSHFNKVFRSATSHSPGEYRKRSK